MRTSSAFLLRQGLIFLAGCGLVAVMALAQPTPTPTPTSSPRPNHGRIAARPAQLPPPRKVQLKFLPEPPRYDERIRARQESLLRDTPRQHWRAIPPPARRPQAPDPQTETRSDQARLLVPRNVGGAFLPHSPPPPDPPSQMSSFYGTSVDVEGGVQSGGRVEPSVAQSGKNVFYTANWLGAHSSDGGLTWSFFDPYADMPDFCCDQDVLYDRGRNLMLWYRQGVSDSNGQNQLLLAASTDGGSNWCEYSFTPSLLNGDWKQGQSFDFPHLAVSNNYVYMHTSMSGPGAPDAVVIRSSLDLLSTCSNGTFYWWGATSYWAGPVQGATTVMYFGDHMARSDKFRIYSQPEATTSLDWKDIGIPGWSLEQGDTCTSADGMNWCSTSDSVVRGGWVAKGTIGFLWHAAAGNGFPFPYVEAATFREDRDFERLGRPYIWSRGGTWHYPFVSPNARGDLGVIAYFGDARSFPSPHVLVYDDYTSHPPPAWEAYRLFGSTAGAPAWGDYVRIRPFQPSQLGWASTAAVSDKTNGIVLLYYVLSRDRDLPSLQEWWQK